jgi:D-glycerate 3-kinase
LEPDPCPAARLDPLLRQGFVLLLLEQLRRWQRQARSGERRLPLIALNGPVGAGKTTLGRQLEALAPQFGLRLRVASIDDLYLSWPERGERLAGNPFGVSRVPPGSHDLPLLLSALVRWRQTGLLTLPRFDKTLVEGQGDRAGWREDACDALVLEGWLMGCLPLPDACLANVLQAVNRAERTPDDWPAAAPRASAGRRRPLSLDLGSGPALRPEEWRWLPHWNRELTDYLPLWQACDGLWLLRPLHWGLPRRWRFQAEAQQRRAGGGWLSAAELERLVRASLCSLPPALYQEPLTRNLPGLSPATTAQDVHESWCDGHDCGSGAAPQITGMDLAWQRPGVDAGTAGRRSDPVTSEGELPPTQAVAWLDGRRRCRSIWLQPSLSPSSSAAG